MVRIIQPDELLQLRESQAPNHVAIVMDGNRRWAYANDVPVEEAHLWASDAISSCIREATLLGIEELTLYALSSKNLGRAPDEVSNLLKLHDWLWPEKIRSTLADQNARVSVIGSCIRDLEEQIQQANTWMATMNENTGLLVRFAVNYSSKVGDASSLVPMGRIVSIPPVDLFIRAGGEYRMSDFLMLESAYAELVFTDTLWPDFTGLHLASAMASYQSRQRRFGL